MEHVAGVGEVQRAADLVEDAEVAIELVGSVDVLGRQLGVSEQVRPRLALDPLEHDQGLVVLVLGDVVDRDDVGVLEATRGPSLLQELAGGPGRTPTRAQGLDRHRAGHGALGGQAHLAHAALPDHLVQLPARGRRRLVEPVEQGRLLA